MDSLFCYPTKKSNKFTVSLLIDILSGFVIEFCENNSRTASTVLNPISSMINMKWELKGAEYLSVKKSVIIVANHQSSLGKFTLTNKET